MELFDNASFANMYSSSVVAKKLHYWLEINLRQLKEGAKHLMLSVKVPVVL